MILATDLDGTFLGGGDGQRLALYQRLRNTPDHLLIFVTGRGIESVRPLLDDQQIPNPHFVIGDVGGSVADGSHLKPLAPLQNELDARWPGREAVAARFKEFQFLQPQDVPQHNRYSYYSAEEDCDFEALEQAAAELDCEILFSAARYLDVLPKGVSKGSTLLKLVEQQSLPFERVVVAGDTLNDLTLFEIGARGIVVGNAEKALKERVPQTDFTFSAMSEGAEGIIEGLVYHGML